MDQVSSSPSNDALLRSGAVALALGAIGLPATAQATVVFTKANATFPATISFNGNDQFTVTTSASDAVPVITATTGTANVIAASGGYTTQFNSGDSISATSFTSEASSQTSLASTKAGPYYIGLALQQTGSNDVNYGFAEIGDTSLFPSEVIEYAFETIPNTAITVTDAPAAVPEPASLALLALGTAGVLGIRRRRPA